MSGKARTSILILIAAAMVAGWFFFRSSEPDGPVAELAPVTPAVVQEDPPVDESSPSSGDKLEEDSSSAWIDSSDHTAAAAALLSERIDLSDPKKRSELVAALEKLDEAHDRAVVGRAEELGLETRGIDEDGTEFVLRGFEGGVPLYEQTENVRAAISTAANLVRSTAPFNVDGTGELIGMWEINQPRETHNEFGNPSRLTFGQLSSGTSNHATHVAGTLIAEGQNPSLKGMAPGATIISYNSSSDSTEMTSVGAAVAGEAGKINVSNHSYGFRRGWDRTKWYGAFVDDTNTSNDFEDDFGRYSSHSVLMDGLTYNLPYYLPFFSAGNHGDDSAPSNGKTWTHGFSSYTYNSSFHPAGDDDYKNGFDTCEGKKVAKNVMTVGAVSDAVSGSSRSLVFATLLDFSSTGPTDDGRIKPDIVANGMSLTSSGGSSNSASYSSSGTSMSSPNAAGSAALLGEYYGSRFPGDTMRSSTLKGLIIHTADDRGNAGPDYRYGWGLMNTLEAAEVVKDHADNGNRMFEERLDAANTTRQLNGATIGGEPLRVTLCWTDPVGVSKNGHENRSKALVNDLNLTVQGPDGTHLPFVMPHVGDWSIATLDDVATTGVNDVDNVEQVYLPSAVGGNYTVTVGYSGSLTHGLQDYSLIITGFDEPFQVEIGSDFTVAGSPGGPFPNPFRDYELINQGSASVSWTATDNMSWIDLSDTSGTLGGGSSDVVRAELNASASSLPLGVYGGEITITSLSTGSVTVIPVSLRLQEPRELPVVEDFEDELDASWEMSGTAASRIILTGSNGPYAGLQHLTMDSGIGGVSSRNELTLTLDLTGKQEVELSFWAKEFGDDVHSPPPSPFVGGADFDGVAVSTDGINWYSVLTFPPTFDSYTEFTIDLDAAMALHGLSYGDRFRIRFNQFDNSAVPVDGYALDDVRVVGNEPPEIEIEDGNGSGLIDEVDLVVADSVPDGDSGDPISLTISNSGIGELRDLVVVVDGADADAFEIGPLGVTTLTPGEETEFTVTFSPEFQGAHSAAIHVTSNDADEGSFDIQLMGFGLHTLRSWRIEYYNTGLNFGHAADLADPNMDGVINLMAFALGLNPLESVVVPFEFQSGGEDLIVSYPRSLAAVAEGLVFEIEWSDTLLELDWSTVGVVQSSATNDGVIEQVDAVVPKGTGKRFVRLQVTKP